MNFHQNTGRTIQQAFEEYHEANPHVYDSFRSLALRAIRLGKKKISFKMIMNVIRWEIYLKSLEMTEVDLKGTGRKFKINDAYGSRYARLFVEEYPEYSDKVELRELRAV